MYWKSNLYRLLPLVQILLFFGFSDLQAQTCDGADGLFPPLSGNTVIANGDICANTAVLPYRWEITYTNVDDSGNPNAVEFFVDWNDGTTQVLTLGGGDGFVQQTGVSSYRAVATHFFPAGGGDVKCEYIPVVSLRINGATCPSTVQNPAPVVRWNTDNENTGNLELSEEVTSNVIFEVCAGETATVRFIDRSEFNCIPANFPGFPPNIRTRWFQFIYGGDPINNTISGSGITINTNTGSNPEGAGNINLLGGATYTSQVVERVQPIDAPTEFTFDIIVPADAQIGEEFAITLNNWNACNPYKSAGIPTGNMPVQFTGLIRIIDSPAAPGNTPQDFCAGQPNILSVVPNSGGFITWYSDAALTNVISTGVTLNAQTDPPAANRVNNTVPGVYTYYATETLGNNCEGPAATVSFEIFENPAPANAGVDQTICNVVSTLNATPPIVGTGQWQVLSGPGIVSNPNSFNSAVTNLTAQTVLQWRVVNGICESFDTITINIDTTPDTANAGTDQTICTDSFNLLANTPSSGNGNWSVISGNGVFSDSSDPNATVSALAIGTNILRWTISNTCSANFDEMTIVNNMPGPANAGPDQSVCSNSTNLNASPLVVGAGTWTFITDDGLGIIADPTAINSIFTGTPGFTYTLEWTVANGVCADNMDQVVITFEENPPPANAGPNQVICGNSTTLEGSPVLIGTGLWTELSGDGNGVFSNNSDPLSQFTGTQGINYTLQWTISNGSCAPSASQVIIQLDDQATQAVAGPDQVICGNSTILQGNTIAVGMGTWSEISGDGAASFVNINDPVTTFSGTIGVTYQLAWSSANGSCPSTQDIVRIQLDPAADIANAGTDLIICGNSTPLGANLPAIGSGSWSVTSGDPFGSFSNVNDPVSNFSGTAGQTYILRWTISSGSCAPTLDEVQVQFDEAPTNASAGISKTVCGDNTLLDANYAVVGTGVWSLLTNPDSQGIFTDSSDPKTSLSGTPGQTYDLRWTISNGVCADSFQDITVSFDAFPSTPDAGADQVICANTTNLQALAPISGTGIWSLVSNPDGLGTVSNPNSNTSPFTGSYGVEYVLRWTVSNGVCSPLFDDVMVKIGPILNAVVINGPSEACLGDIVNYTIPGADPSLYNYIWDLSGIPPTVNAIPGSGNPFQFISLKVDESFVGTVSVAIQDKSSGCIGPVTSVPLQVFDKPDVVLTSSDIDKFVCQNEEVVFTATDLNGVATQYEFVLNGTVVQSGPSNTYVAKTLAVGNSMVVRAFNGICPSSSTTPLVHVVNLNPVAFTVLGGGDICEGEVSSDIRLNNSVSGETYELYFNDTPTGVTVASTGGQITFPPQDQPGEYTVYASNLNSCATKMNGSAIIIVNPLPQAFDITGGNTICEGDAGIYVSMSSSEIGVKYQVFYNGSPFGQKINGTGGAMDFGPFDVAGNYEVNAANADKCEIIMNGMATLVVDPLPVANIVNNSPVLCATGQTDIVLETVTGNAIFSWTVDFNPAEVTGASNSTLAVPEGFIIQQNLQNITTSPVTVTYNILPENSCEGKIASVMVLLNPAPEATISGESTICEGTDALINFTSFGKSPFDIEYWEGNTLNLIAGVGTSHALIVAPATTTTYRIESITDANGCRFYPLQQEVVIEVISPKASFVALQALEGCSPSEFVFENTNVSPGFTYEWTWGDGTPKTISSATNVSHIFTNGSNSINRVYTVSLTAIFDNGNLYCADFVSTEVTIYPDVVPDVVPDNIEGCSPLTVSFINRSKGAETHNWYYRVKGTNVQQGVTNEPTPQFQLNNATSKPVVYEIVYEAGNTFCSNAQITDITIYPEVQANFTVNGSVTPSFVIITDPTHASIGATVPNNPGWTYHWDYGDGNTSEGYQPQSPYTYANAGDYEIKLMVTEPDGGCFNEFSVSLRVEAILPVIDFTATPVSGCRPLKVQFTNQSFSVDPATYFWEFMDSDGVVIGSSTMPNPEFTFYDAGFYSVSLSGKNILGTEAKSTKNNIIEVFSRPTAAFLIRPNKLFIPGGILYTQNLSINATEFHWDFGDGTTSDLYAPEHEYTMTGTYTVELVAVNSNGCTDTLTMQSAVSVMEGGTLRVPNAFTPSLNGPTGGIAGGGTHNDVFKPIIEGATEYQMMIFDRWGNLIFETEDLDKGWDGYDKNGRLLPTGVYVYKMRLKFGNGEYFEKIGDVTLIR